MNATPLFEAIASLNAAKGSGFIQSVHRNGDKGIAFRNVWPGDKVDFVEFSLFKTAEGEFAELGGYYKLIK